MTIVERHVFENKRNNDISLNHIPNKSSKSREAEDLFIIFPSLCNCCIILRKSYTLNFNMHYTQTESSET